MVTTSLLGSKPLRLVLAVLYSTLVVWLAVRTQAGLPVLCIALGLPLVFRLVPRNWIYGMRTPGTMFTSEEKWYRQNVITGVVLVIVGTVWLVVLAAR